MLDFLVCSGVRGARRFDDFSQFGISLGVHVLEFLLVDDAEVVAVLGFTVFDLFLFQTVRAEEEDALG